jgi:hypothetical protein
VAALPEGQGDLGQHGVALPEPHPRHLGPGGLAQPGPDRRPGFGVAPGPQVDQGEPGVDAQSFRRRQVAEQGPGLLQQLQRRPGVPFQP